MDGLFRLALLVLGLLAGVVALFVFTQPREVRARRADQYKKELSQIIGPHAQALEWSAYCVGGLLFLGWVFPFWGDLLDWPWLTNAGNTCWFLGMVAIIFVLMIIADIARAHEVNKAHAALRRPTYVHNINNSGIQNIDSSIIGGTQRAEGNSMVISNFLPEQLCQLREELTQLRIELSNKAKLAEHYVAIGEVAAAEQNAANGDEKGMKAHLLKAGRWAFNAGTEVSTTLLAEYLKSVAGLK